MESASAQFSRSACTTCRSQKRKCTRRLPSCEACEKNNRRCEYPYSAVGNTNALDKLAFEAAPDQHLPSPLFFLDSYLFGHLKSQYVIEQLDSSKGLAGRTSWAGYSAEQIIEIYFSTTHKHFPIISRRLFEQYLLAEYPRRQDHLLLLQCLCLLSVPVGTVEKEEKRKLYLEAKWNLRNLEDHGIISATLIQAATLIALYEAGNAIFPAAFLSIGHCIQLGHAMGIHDRRNTLQLSGNSRSWTEAEELRRTWWGVRVLERYIHLGVSGRPFSCADAPASERLPMNDALWDSGEQSAVPSLAISADASIPAPPFARTCQAAHLLSRVLAHINITTEASSPVERYSRAMQLHSVLISFQDALQQEWASEQTSNLMHLSSAMGICHSAIIALCDEHTCADADDPAGMGIPEQLKMQGIALDTLLAMLPGVAEWASQLDAALGKTVFGEAEPSPFVAQAIYATAKQLLWYIKETRKTCFLPSVEKLKALLHNIGKRWNVANEYLMILDSAELLVR